MRKIEAVVRHEAVESLRRSLAEEGLPSVSVAEAKVFPRRDGRLRALPRARIEMVVQVDDLDRALALIARHAVDGTPHDELMLVLPVGEAIRVRTTQRGRGVVAAHTGLDL